LPTGQWLRRRRRCAVSYNFATRTPSPSTFLVILRHHIDLLTTEVPPTKGYDDACVVRSLRDSQVTAHFRDMLDPIGGQLGRDAFTVATYASSVGIATIMLQDREGGLQPFSYRARKLNPAERGNTYSAYDLEALAVCEAVKHWWCYLEGCSKFLVVTNHDTLRHMLRQPNNKMNKRQTRHLRDLQPFAGSRTFASRKGALNEIDPLSRRPYFVPQATFPLF
jgi:hypothetical protein